MQHTAGGHNDEKDILPFSNRLYSCDFAAADHALRLLCLPHTSAHGRVNSVDMRRETELYHYKDYSLQVSSNML